VDIYRALADIGKDPIISRGFSANIMMFRQAVNRNGHTKQWDVHPFLRHWHNAASDQKRVNAYLTENRKDSVQFTMPKHGLTADQRNMNGVMLLY
jgi:hypothetical protein